MSRSLSDVEDLTLDSEYNEEEEEEEGAEEEESVEEEPEIYYSEDFISGPILSEESTLPGNILEFDYSYGYDCKRYYNLTVADENTLIFASGNLINFFNVQTKEHWFRRSASGGGIGHITKNPNPEFPHIAIGENGINPPIIIYDWPSLEIVCLLKNGTSRCFTHLNYSSDGMLLASQGGEPDHLITIFNWAKSRILLRTKSNVNDVYRVIFSPYVPGQLTTGGLTHIKFWKMVNTFTGLKLQGELGRFGKTEYCDILGIYPMPDEKVISGCEWGNLLVWDEGLISVEVCGRKKTKCHEAPIVQFYYSNGELWTVGMDGKIKVWFYDTIDQADPPDDYRLVEVEPIYEFHIPNVMFMSIYKQNYDPEDAFYFAQDGNGGLWRINLNTDEDHLEPPEQLYRCHAGAVVDIAACPWGPYLASLGIDGRLQLYQYIERKLIFVHQYPAKGSSMVWLPLHEQISGDQLIMGFDDGNLRVVVLDIEEKSDTVKATTIQVTKPHNRPVTKISLNSKGTVLVTGGEDATIFVFEVISQPSKFSMLVPIGYIPVPGIVTFLDWHHLHNRVVLVGCIQGHFLQVTVPPKPQPYTTITYILQLKPRLQRFVTYKAQIRRDIKVREIEGRKAEKREIKQIELDRIKLENPGLEIDDEIFLADSDSEEELEPLHIPEIPNRVLWMQSTDEDTIWLSMGGYDAGYIYEYNNDQTSDIPANFEIICDGDDIEISSFVYNNDRKYLILAMQDGSIRVVKVNLDDWRDLSDYWQLSMHDNYNGFIPRMCFSHEEKYFFTCGHDGNIFSYRFYPEEGNYLKHTTPNFPFHTKPQEVQDVDGYANLSLEEAIVKAEDDRIQNVANENKRILREKLKNYRDRFNTLLERNNNLKPTQVIPRERFEIDPRITRHLQENLNANLALVKRKLEFQVEKSSLLLRKLKRHFIDGVDILPVNVKGVQNHVVVRTTRQRQVLKELYDMLETVENKILGAELMSRVSTRAPVIAEAAPPLKRTLKRLEYVINSLSPTTIQRTLGPQLARYIEKYRTSRQKKARREEEWLNFKVLQPKEGVSDPTDVDAISNASKTIGNYPLKSSPNYKVPKHLQETLIKKYKQLLLARLKQFNIRHNFSAKVVELHHDKIRLRADLTQLNSHLEDIHKELPEDYHKSAPSLPDLANASIEDNLEVVVELPDYQQEILEIKYIVPPPKGDLLEKEVLTTTITPNLIVKQKKLKIEIPSEPNEILEQCKENDTLWEIEVREYRLMRNIFSQDLILHKMQDKITKFDKKVHELAQERRQICFDADFLDIHLLTLNEELCILEEIESVETRLQEKFKTKMENVFDVKDAIQSISNQLAREDRTIKESHGEENNIRDQFYLSANDSKFYDFLRRIFRKKYRLPKVHDPDDSSSESSSSSDESEEENDTGSVDSRDFGILRLDENVCPKGCDIALYNKTFDLRSKRHQVERAIQQHVSEVAVLIKDLDKNNKNLRIIENQLKLSREELELFQREKQGKLNKVRTTVVLKLHQLQHMVSEGMAEKISNTLLFSKKTLSKLYKRVGELYNETLKQKSAHRKNIMHASRMRTDCKFMHRKIKELKLAVVDSMFAKFGKEVDMEELQEAELKMKLQDVGIRIGDEDQMNYITSLNMHQAIANIRNLYQQELKLWENKYRDKQTELVQITRDNTARVDLLSMLNHEKTELAKLIVLQKQKKGKLRDVADVFKEDIQKLSRVVQKQSVELQLLKDEIARMGRKGLPPFSETLAIEKRQKKHQEEQEQEKADQAAKLQLSKRQSSEVQIAKDEEENLYIGPRPSLVLNNETEEMVKSLILQMLLSIESYQNISTVKGLVEEIVKDVMARSSVAEIIDNLIALLPVDPDDQQYGFVEATAEQIFCLLQPEAIQEDDADSPRGILNTIIDNVLLTTASPENVITKLLSELVEKLPIDFLLTKSSIDTIINKTKGTLTSGNTDSADLIQAVLSFTSANTVEMHVLFDEILQEVFGTGIDYLFILR